jgi:hypothetical protein
MALDPSIALGIRPLEVPNQLAQYAQMAQVENAQRQGEAAQMQLEQLKQDRVEMQAFQKHLAASGNNPDLKQFALMLLKSPKHYDKGAEMMQKLQEQEKFETMGRKLYPELFGAAPAGAGAMPMAAPAGAMPMAAPVGMPSGALGSGTFGMMPEPVNNLAPAPAAPSNALVAPVGKTPDQLRKEIMLFGGSNAPGAKNMVDMLKAQLTESLKQTDTQREMQALGLPLTPEGFKQYTALKQPAPQPVELTRALADRDKLIALGRPVNDPDVVAYTKLINKLTTHTPSAQQNVYAFTPASVKAQEQFVQAASDERKVLRNAPDTLANIDAAIKLIPTASTFMGTGGEPLLAAASFLNNRLGFGISTQGVTDATVLRTRLFEGILDNLKKLDSQPSQEQQRVLSEALGNLGTDPAALKQILNRIGETVRSRVDRFNTDVTDAETRGVKFPFTPQIKLPEPKFAPGAAAAQIPGQGPAPAAVSNSVTLPDGRVKTFPNADAANQFKKAAGL